MDIWQEIEAKVNSDSDVPGVKTSNKVCGLSLSVFTLSVGRWMLLVWANVSICISGNHIYLERTEESSTTTWGWVKITLRFESQITFIILWLSPKSLIFFSHQWLIQSWSPVDSLKRPSPRPLRSPPPHLEFGHPDPQPLATLEQSTPPPSVAAARGPARVSGEQRWPRKISERDI